MRLRNRRRLAARKRMEETKKLEADAVVIEEAPVEVKKEVVAPLIDKREQKKTIPIKTIEEK